MRDPVIRDSLTTTSANGKRIRIFPAEVLGKWHQRRVGVQWFMIAIYLVLPWLRLGGHPLLMLDLEHRRFSIFGKVFFAQEVPNLVFLTLSFLLLMGLFTSWFGRVWCGWACPQTVFIERVFRAVERWVEGNALKRKSLHESPWTLEKILKKSLKWILFFGLALILSHSFLAYFVGSEASFDMMTRSPALHPKSFLLIVLFTGIVLFDFGWFREQFCLVACPYGRFQSVMMDDASLFIHYDKTRKDCIDCYKCVSACPTGIDIRNGVQMECIACTACVDACDLVMSRIQKPKGLISYQSLQSIFGKKTRFFRPRPLVYLGLLSLCLSILSYRLSMRTPYWVEVTRAVDTPYQVLKDQAGGEWVLNHFKIHLGNRSWDDLNPHVELLKQPEDGSELIFPPGLNQPGTVKLHSGDAQDLDVFAKIPRSRLDPNTGDGNLKLKATWSPGRESWVDLQMIGPGHDL